MEQQEYWVDGKYEGEQPDWVKSYQEKRAILSERMRERKDHVHQGTYRSANNRFCALGLAFDTLSKMYPNRFKWVTHKGNRFGKIVLDKPEVYSCDQHGNETKINTILSIESWLGVDESAWKTITDTNDRKNAPKPSWGEMADLIINLPYTKQPELFSWDKEEQP